MSQLNMTSGFFCRGARKKGNFFKQGFKMELLYHCSVSYLTASSTFPLSIRPEVLSGDVTTNQKDTLGVSSHTMMFDTLVKFHKTVKTTHQCHESRVNDFIMV